MSLWTNEKNTEKDIESVILTTQELNRQNLLICATRSERKVMAIDIEIGEISWTYKCPGGGYSIPVAILELSNWESGRPKKLFYAGAGKWSSHLAAESHSAFSQNPVAQYREVQRGKER
ncbi:hypothetical protein MFLAVUS_004591 [Mucor flavus]|uniref:Uncharacterized protein n=1 Tax=Mucor flavus TaxID=439312 RepID=A0ABP9YWC6_9FUNG